MCYFRSVSKVHDEWFADEERVRKAVGILERPVVSTLDGGEVYFFDLSTLELFFCIVRFGSSRFTDAFDVLAYMWNML